MNKFIQKTLEKLEKLDIQSIRVLFAQLAAENAGRRAMDKGVARVDVYCKGPGSARETAIRTLQTIGIEVSEIKDVTPTPHNGCRPKKRRRV